MTDKPDRVTITVLPGDAALIIKESGETHLAINTRGKPTDATLCVIGLSLALENETWRRGLVNRTIEKLEEDAANAASGNG
jgi:hypothetical protein